MVPEGTTVIFHQPAGSGLEDGLGKSIEGGTASRYNERYGPGSRIPDYTLHPPDGLNIEATSVTVTDSTLLGELLRPGMGSVDWAACRSPDRFDMTVVRARWVWRPETNWTDGNDDSGNWAGLTESTSWRLTAPVVLTTIPGHVPGPT